MCLYQKTNIQSLIRKLLDAYLWVMIVKEKDGGAVILSQDDATCRGMLYLMKHHRGSQHKK